MPKANTAVMFLHLEWLQMLQSDLPNSECGLHNSEVPTRINVCAPILESSSTAMAVEGPPLDVGKTRVPLGFPYVRYSLLWATSWLHQNMMQ